MGCADDLTLRVAGLPFSDSVGVSRVGSVSNWISAIKTQSSLESSLSSTPSPARPTHSLASARLGRSCSTSSTQFTTRLPAIGTPRYHITTLDPARNKQVNNNA